jgi:hypothetical protein
LSIEIDRLIDKIRALEEELEVELAKRAEELRIRIRDGKIEYTREIAARTEQYWCPIKHASRIKAAHGRYSRFVDYGDAEAYRENLKKVRENFEAE